jgi:hypothetical protein
MLEPLGRRTIIFFIARCHGDLSWYLSVDTSKLAANDNDLARTGAAGADKPVSRLRVVETPTE